MNIYSEIKEHVKNGHAVLMYIETEIGWHPYPVKLRLITPISCEYTWVGKEFVTSCFVKSSHVTGQKINLDNVFDAMIHYDYGATKISYEIL